jgi:hypothetical protein
MPPRSQAVWHIIFRLTVNERAINKNASYLGDRTLSAWVGTPFGGCLHFPTYTYTNLNGAGNANYYQNIAHKNRHNEWHFIYFAYSRKLRKSKVFVQFKGSKANLNYNTNHYVPEKFYLWLGRDQHGYPHYSGSIGYVRVIFGKGAFDDDNDFHEEGDPFAYDLGWNNLLKEKPRPKPEDRKDLIDDDDDEFMKTGGTTPAPVDKTVPEDKMPRDVSEYGYGFWFRFLTTYPERLLAGKNAPWYFLARFTTNIPHSDIGMGDRVLAIWQGQGYYHFTTCNAPAN